jgi:hypothetical protein
MHRDWAHPCRRLHEHWAHPMHRNWLTTGTWYAFGATCPAKTRPINRGCITPYLHRCRTL